MRLTGLSPKKKNHHKRVALMEWDFGEPRGLESRAVNYVNDSLL